MQQLHNLREAWKKTRVQHINLLRGILRELGVAAPSGTQAFLRQACELIERPEVCALRGALQMVLGEISLCEQSMRDSEEQLARWHADDDIVHKLDEVSGIGLLTASALKTAVGKPERFASGRHLSAWLGMTPNEYSSGERRRLGCISCKGNTYVRTLLIHGARAFASGSAWRPAAPRGRRGSAAALGPANGRTYRPQQSRGGPGEQTGEDLLGSVVP